jgi:hypothetical protein
VPAIVLLVVMCATVRLVTSNGVGEKTRHLLAAVKCNVTIEAVGFVALASLDWVQFDTQQVLVAVMRRT